MDQEGLVADIKKRFAWVDAVHFPTTDVFLSVWTTWDAWIHFLDDSSTHTLVIQCGYNGRLRYETYGANGAQTDSKEITELVSYLLSQRDRMTPGMVALLETAPIKANTASS